MIQWDDVSSLEPRCLELEWSSPSREEEGVRQRCLELEWSNETYPLFHELPLTENIAPIRAEHFVLSQQQVLDDALSVLTAETSTVCIDSPNPKPAPLKFILDPFDLELAVKAVCRQTNNSPPKAISRSKMTVLSQLEHLPYHRGMCPCQEMSHLASPDFQSDIRTLYVMVCSEGGDDLGDDFLMSMLVQSHRLEGEDLEDNTSFLVPGFKDDGECRRFRICREQFINLFGLTEAGLRRLETRWKRGIANGNDEDRVFGWSSRLLSYKVGLKHFMVVWIE